MHVLDGNLCASHLEANDFIILHCRACGKMSPNYPLIVALDNQLRLPETSQCLSAPAPSALNKLQMQPLDTYLVRLMPEVDRYFSRMQQKTETFIEITSLVIRIEVGFQSSPSPIPEQLVQDTTLGAHPQMQSRFPATENVKDAVIHLDFVILLNNFLLDHVNHVLASVEDLKEKTMKKLRQLKTNLISFTKYLDVILLHYTHHIGDLPTFQAVNESKAAILKIVAHINPEELKKIIPRAVRATGEDILCAAIGLNANIATELKNLDVQFREHQPEVYYLRHFLSRNIRSCDNKGLNADRDALHAVLMETGFSDARANILIDSITRNELSKQQGLEYWVKWYLSYMFDYDVFLHDDCPHYPFHEKVIDEWKEIDIDLEELDDESGSFMKVPVINTTYEKVHLLTKNEFKFPPAKQQPNLWYHGTLHKSAKHIMYNGIHVNIGSQQQDFSDGSGFYLTPDYEYALNWSKGKGSEAAVLVFDIDLTSVGFQGMDLSDRDVDWEKIVSYNRCGRCKDKFKLPNDLQKEFKNCDYIKGPMGSGGNSFTKQILGCDGSKIMQICIRSRKMAEVFSRNLSAVIFVNN